MNKKTKNHNNKITEEKLDKYFNLTKKALSESKKSVIKGKEIYAKEIFEMVSNYLSDAIHFKEKGNFVDSFAAINYAHGWIDAGVRLDVFNVDDDSLFTIK